MSLITKCCLLPPRYKLLQVVAQRAATSSSSTSLSLVRCSPYSTTSILATKERPLSKHDLVEEISTTHEMSMAKSQRIVNTIFDTIVESVAEDREVRLTKFGSFAPYQSPERTGRNPQTGEPMTIPAKKRVRFRPSDAFKISVNGS